MDLQTHISKTIKALSSNRALDSHKRDLIDFSVFIGTSRAVEGELPRWSPTEGAAALLVLFRGPPAAPNTPQMPWGPRQALGTLVEYQKALLESGAAPATINRRLTLLRNLIRSARKYGAIAWFLPDKAVPWCQTMTKDRGPTREGILRILKYLVNEINTKHDKKAIRDYAIVRLLYSNALRRSELTQLNPEHVDFENNRIWVYGRKADGQRQGRWVKLASSAREAVEMWLRARGQRKGPLFYPLSGPGAGYYRLSETSVYRTIVELGRKSGVKARPLALRHARLSRTSM